MIPSSGVLSWHPKFQTYTKGTNEVLLLAEDQFLVLDQLQFPGIRYIDGINTVAQIEKNLTNNMESSLFYYQLEQLCQRELLVELRNSSTQAYQCQPASGLRSLSSKILSLSAAEHPLQQQWVALLKPLTHAHEIHFILVDDLTDQRIAAVLKDLRRYLVIKICGKKLMFTPLSTPNKPLSWQQFSRQLSQNQPVRLLIDKLHPNHNRFIPFALGTVLTEQQLQHIGVLLNQLISDQKQRLATFELATHAQQYHFVNPYYHQQTKLTTQLQQAITLKPGLVVNNNEGGSRQFTPAHTYSLLEPLLSPVTGVLTHVEPLTPTSKANQLTIYKSVFFKTPWRSPEAQLSNECFIQTCLGKGITDDQSKVSAIAEAIERQAALYQGDEPLLLARQSDLRQRSLNYAQLTPYSQEQYQNFSDPNHPDSQQRQAAKPYLNHKIHWITTWSLTHQQPVMVPMSMCFNNLPFTEAQYGRWNSNGCAAGNSLEEAILQGLYEVIERDAVATWWYNRCTRPAYDHRQLDPEQLTKIDQTLSTEHEYWVLDLTHDIGVPVMVAIAQHRQSGQYTLGLGCHLLPQIAAQRALTELIQLQQVLNLSPTTQSGFDFSKIVTGDYLHPHSQLSRLTPFSESKNDLGADIQQLTDRLQSLGFETLVLNYSRSHLPLKTAKVFVPGLSHVWPQLANKRLYKLAVTLGWSKRKLTPDTINPQALFI